MSCHTQTANLRHHCFNVKTLLKGRLQHYVVPSKVPDFAPPPKKKKKKYDCTATTTKQDGKLVELNITVLCMFMLMKVAN